MQKQAIKLKKTKCTFSNKEVTDLGFCINENGIFSVNENIEELVNAKLLEDVMQLNSFLGIIYYYRSEFPSNK